MTHEAKAENGSNLRELLKVGSITTLLTLGAIGLQQLLINAQNENKGGVSGNPVELFNPNKKAKIVHEYPDGQDPSIILQQRLADGRVAIIRKPVFEGELLVREPGDVVIPSKLEPPLPD